MPLDGILERVRKAAGDPPHAALSYRGRLAPAPLGKAHRGPTPQEEAAPRAGGAKPPDPNPWEEAAPRAPERALRPHHRGRAASPASRAATAAAAASSSPPEAVSSGASGGS